MHAVAKVPPKRGWGGVSNFRGGPGGGPRAGSCGSSQVKAATAEDRYRCSHQLGAPSRYKHTDPRPLFPILTLGEDWKPCKKLSAPARRRELGDLARRMRATPDARGPSGRESPVPPRRGAEEPARTAEGGTHHRPTGRAGESYVGTPGMAWRRPGKPGP